MQKIWRAFYYLKLFKTIPTGTRVLIVKLYRYNPTLSQILQVTSTSFIRNDLLICTIGVCTGTQCLITGIYTKTLIHIYTIISRFTIARVASTVETIYFIYTVAVARACVCTSCTFIYICNVKMKNNRTLFKWKQQDSSTFFLGFHILIYNNFNVKLNRQQNSLYKKAEEVHRQNQFLKKINCFQNTCAIMTFISAVEFQ